MGTDSATPTPASAGHHLLRRSLVIRCAIGLGAGLLSACGASPEPATRDVIVWQKLGAWTGNGVLQTDPFESETGTLRVMWEARQTDPSAEGRFKVAVHSAVSGRHLARLVDHRGPGRDTVYLNEDPRGFFLVIESTGLDWTVEVAEGIPAKQRASVP